MDDLAASSMCIGVSGYSIPLWATFTGLSTLMERRAYCSRFNYQLHVRHLSQLT